MFKPLITAIGASLLVAVSLALWRISYEWTDWAALALLPVTAAVIAGAWPLALRPWRARLDVVLRQDSSLRPLLTGNLRAGIITLAFTGAAVFMLAWQARTADLTEAVIMLMAFFLGGFLFSTSETWLARHLHKPFSASAATSFVTWAIGIPFILILALYQHQNPSLPGAIQAASLQGAIEIGLSELPERDGWITTLLKIPASFEAFKVWVIVQLKDYPLAAMLFSIDAALFGFVLCRASVLITQAIEAKIFVERN